MGRIKFVTVICLMVLALNGMGQTIRKYNPPPDIGEEAYSYTKIIVRLGSDQENSARIKLVNIEELAQKMGVERLEKIIRHSSADNQKSKAHPLSDIYKVFLKPGQDPIEVINKFLLVPEVRYAEPYFLHKPLFVPNDPESKTNKQQGPYLSLIKAYEAWDLSRGDTTMIVAILDTGTKLNHEDLEDNLWINYDDPVNGIDDDEDGLVDNYFGYDLADDDNDPTADIDGHGAEVSGVSNATTNNATGMAGIGFNSKYMPLKIFTSEENLFLNGYEAIIFAADKGAGIINLSWGSEDSYTQFGEDAINYAVLEKDAVVVASAGNTNEELNFYPASFDNVLSVGATNNNDEKTSWGTYSYNIDLMAPGEGIYTTRSDGTYGTNQGTSFSSPLVAGAAALLRSYTPELTAQQIMEKIRVTADDIYEIPANQPYYGQLGKGRLNILHALTDNISPSVRFKNMVYDNKNGQQAFFADTLTISGDFTNFLEPTQNLALILTSESPFVSVLDPIIIIGGLGTEESFSLADSPFQVVLSADTPPDTRLVFRLDFKDGFYEDFQYFEIFTEPDYTTVNNGALALTLSGNGNLGYNQNGYSGGIGLTLDDENLLDHLGLILATEDPSFFSNNSIEIFDSNHRDQDFQTQQNIRFYNNSVAQMEVRSSFQETDTLPNPIGIKIDQKLITNDPTQGNFLILEYRLINQSGNQIDTLHTSLFADWDLREKELNIAKWSEEDSLGYVYYPESDSLFAGIALLTSQLPIHSASTRTILGDTLERTVKHENVSNGVINNGSASSGNEEDVLHFVGGTVLDLAPDETEKVTFILTAGGSISEIKANLDSAKSYYSFYNDNPPLGYTAYTCEGDSAFVDPPGTNYDFYADINRDSLIYSGEFFKTPPVIDPIIFYGVNIDEAYEGEMIQMKADIKSLDIDFDFQPDTVFLDESGNNHAQFLDLSKDAIIWNWDFDNGFASTIKNPATSYFSSGIYDVTLFVENDIGCSDTVSKPVSVLQRSPKPLIDSQLICKGETATIDPSNASMIRVYSDLDLTDLVFEGDVFVSGAITSDTSFYVTNIDSPVESLPTESEVEITGLVADFEIALDTLNLDIKYLVSLLNGSKNALSYEWQLDGNTLSTAQDTLFDYTGLTSFDLTLIATDTLGCSLGITKSYSPTTSPSPSVEIPYPICKGGSVFLEPEGAEIFFFYRDPALDSLVSKGKSLQLDSLSLTSDIYIIAMDSLFDSDTLRIPITVSSLTADFSMTPDSLNLTEENFVQFQSLSGEAISWFWDFDNGQTDSTAAPLISFDDPGEYMIFLRTTDSISCLSVNEKMLPVVSILSLEERRNDAFSIYPNPTHGQLSVQFKRQVAGPSRIALYNSQGILVFQKSVNIRNSAFQLNLPDLPRGYFYLQIEVNGEVSVAKLMLE